jgi:hypothetical protein
MHKRTADPSRLRDTDERLTDAMEAAQYLVEHRGTRGAALLLEWTQADLSRIANARWREIKMYPETVEALLLAYTVVANDAALIDPVRVELHEFSRELGALVKRAAKIRGMIKKVTR